MRVFHLVIFSVIFLSSPAYGRPSRRRPAPEAATVAEPLPPPWARNAFDALNSSRQSVYMITTVPQVVSQTESGKTVLRRIPAGAGQAFLVGKNLLMSANHITENTKVGDTIWVWNRKTVSFGTIVYQHPVVDFVLIEADLPDGVPLILKAEERYEDGIVFLGNFYQFGNAPNNVEAIAKLVRVRNEIPSMIGKNAASQSASSYLVFEGVFKPGDSGAPVFNQDGYVIGMLTMIAKNNEKDELGNGITLGVPSRVLLFLYTEYLLEKGKKLSTPLNKTP